MPRRKREGDEERPEEEEEPQRQSSRPPAAPRLSITLDAKLRKKIRLAAALRDMEPNEWARIVLVTAARKTVERHFPDAL